MSKTLQLPFLRNLITYGDCVDGTLMIGQLGMLFPFPRKCVHILGLLEAGKPRPTTSNHFLRQRPLIIPGLEAFTNLHKHAHTHTGGVAINILHASTFAYTHTHVPVGKRHKKSPSLYYVVELASTPQGFLPPPVHLVIIPHCQHIAELTVRACDTE